MASNVDCQLYKTSLSDGHNRAVDYTLSTPLRPRPHAADFRPSPLDALRVLPPTCKRIECPAFDVIDRGDGFEIRRYSSTPWMSTALIEDISFVEATREGFLQ
ncbi:hypothetical protein HPP92_004053 [Vanilla planifolia]|uniref:Uncharacterized protein n=1 Tax=Vanilla planifolia TaxID=51239 RepID=A0A835S8B7_VANPL|nr:hypothetical protein HPP92_004053 [Vanilla planifolia]